MYFKTSFIKILKKTGKAAERRCRTIFFQLAFKLFYNLRACETYRFGGVIIKIDVVSTLKPNNGIKKRTMVKIIDLTVKMGNQYLPSTIFLKGNLIS